MHLPYLKKCVIFNNTINTNKQFQMLEKRTKDSKREMEMMEALEDLKEMNDQKALLNVDEVLKKRMKIHKETDEERRKREEAEIEEEIKLVEFVINFEKVLF